MNKRIIYPIAAGGNHLRWLMYFDKSFDKMHLASDKSPDHKLKFIESRVYTKERSWYNWLEFESKHRRKYDYIIELDHEHYLYKHKKNTKTIVMTFNDYTESIIRFILFFDLGNMSMHDILTHQFIQHYDSHIKSQKFSPNEKVITSDVIWEDVLDKNFYYDIIDFWELEDHYDYAAKVHTLWINCQKQALTQFIETCKNDEYINFIKTSDNYLKSISFNRFSTD